MSWSGEGMFVSAGNCCVLWCTCTWHTSRRMDCFFRLETAVQEVEGSTGFPSVEGRSSSGEGFGGKNSMEIESRHTRSIWAEAVFFRGHLQSGVEKVEKVEKVLWFCAQGDVATLEESRRTWIGFVGLDFVGRLREGGARLRTGELCSLPLEGVDPRLWTM